MRAFDNAYEKWLMEHMKKRSGERLRRLEKGLGFGEKLLLKEVWWPSFGNFDNLHPEYEVRDFGGGYRYLDLAFIRSLLRVNLESDGFGPHWKDITRQEFSYNLNRQNMLVIEGFKVIRFSRDDIMERPRLCQQMVQQLIGKYINNHQLEGSLKLQEKELIRYAIRNGGVLSPIGTCKHLGITFKTAKTLLAGMESKGILVVASGQTRITKFRLNELYHVEALL